MDVSNNKISSGLLGINRGLEILWLLTVIFVPLVFLGRSYGEWSSILESYELPKIALLRTLAGLMASLWLIEWGLQHGGNLNFVGPGGEFSVRPGAWFSSLRQWLRGEPTRWLVLAVVIYLASTLLSTALSASFSVSMWGDFPGQNSYGAYTVISYVIIFGVIATHLKTRAQLSRILSAFAAMGVLVAAYAIFQHYGHDFLDLREPPNTGRASSTLGNSTFAASVLLITILVSLFVATVNLKGRLKEPAFWWRLGLWTSILTIQFLGIAFTLTRGPWVGLAFGLLVMLGLTAAFAGWRFLAKTGLVLGLALALTLVVLLVTSGTRREANPDAPTPTDTAAGVVAERLTSAIQSPVGGGIGGRTEIWEGSWRLITERPWFDFDNLSLSALRPLVGYGPDFFRYTYLLESPSGFRRIPSEPTHAHNYFIHQAVELGLFGFLASVGVFVAFFGASFSVGRSQLIRVRSGLSDENKLILIMLLAAVAGKLLEQMVGVARVSDLTLLWVLLGTFIAASMSMRERPTSENLPPARRQLAQSAPSRPGHQGKDVLGNLDLLIGLLIAGLVVGIGVVTWTKNVNYVRAAVNADQAAEQFRDGQVLRSISSIDRAIDLAPDVSNYYENRATVYVACRQGQQRIDLRSSTQSTSQATCDPEERHKRNRQWVERRSFSFRARLSLADSTLELGLLNQDASQIDESINLYREAAEMVPNSWALWDRLGEVYIQVGQPRSALSPLEKSREITGDTEFSYEALVLEARVYQNLGQTMDAIEKSSLAIQRFPEGPEAPYIRGTTYYGLGQFAKALEDLDQAILINPIYGLAYNNRGLVYARIGRPDLAVADFTQSVNLEPGLAIAYNNRGFTYRDLGDLELAIEDLTRAIDLDPGFALAYYNRALAYVRLGESVKAQEDAARAVELGFDPIALEAAMAESRRRAPH